MSIEKIENVFKNLGKGTGWSLLLLKIEHEADATIYESRRIRFAQDLEMMDFLKEISEKYCSAKGLLNSYTGVEDYSGTSLNTAIFKVDQNKMQIQTEYNSFLSGIADPNVEAEPFDYTTAYMLQGRLSIGRKSERVKLISMQNPVTTLKQKYQFLHSSGSFEKIKNQVLTLRTAFDVIIIEDTVYFLTPDGERLFNMARAFKKICRSRISDVEKSGIISDIEKFKDFAEKGYNPRRFASFNEERLKRLADAATREKMANQFSIQRVGDLFDSSSRENVDKIVKLLCNKGMMDPFEEAAVEVSSSKKWQ